MGPGASPVVPPPARALAASRDGRRFPRQGTPPRRRSEAVGGGVGVIVLVTVSLGDDMRRRVAERIESLGGKAVFASDACTAAVEPEVLFGPAPVEYIAAQPRLRWVQTHSAGVDHLLGKEIPFPRHVKLTNASGVYGVAGGEHVLAMMLYFARGLHVFGRNQRKRAWIREIEH